jgi:glycosyltransferase involved in cell wall biosynthesis
VNDRLAITFVLPVLNETRALEATVETIMQVAEPHIHEILIVVCDHTLPESLAVAERLRDASVQAVRLHWQRLPRLGGALRDAFEIAGGTHVLVMASDLETDPRCIPQFVDRMREGTWDIVAASRWLPGGGFHGYGGTKQVLNRLFQLGCRILYGTRLTDMTYAYRLYRRDVLDGIVWDELGHPFLLECLLKPLRLGARIVEVPCPWRPRSEGTSANSLRQMFAYVRTALRIRWTARQRLRRTAAA